MMISAFFFTLGVLLTATFGFFKYKSIKSLSDKIILEAKNESARLLKEASLQAERVGQDFFRSQKLQADDVNRLKNELAHREQEQKRRQETLNSLEKNLKEKEEALLGTTPERAIAALKKELLEKGERDIQKELEALKEDAERAAKKTVLTCMGRIASQLASSGTLQVISLKDPSLKSKIIGREGRNVRFFEERSGVNVFLDEKAAEVHLSCFNPERLHVAKQALIRLINDGRIHPTKIEEAFSLSEKALEGELVEIGRSGALRAGVLGLHEEILRLLGRCHFRASFGQNVLEHLIEVSALMGRMAEELSLDAPIARRIGLLHDMGKASLERGSHALVGHEIALRYGEKKQVANGIGCHHGEMEPITFEGAMTAIADTLSATRPLARCGEKEALFQRQRALEAVAMEFEEVERAFAIEAGRALRVLLKRGGKVGADAMQARIVQRIGEQVERGVRVSVVQVAE